MEDGNYIDPKSSRKEITKLMTKIAYEQRAIKYFMIFHAPLYPKGNPLRNGVAVQETGKFLPQRSRTGGHESTVTEFYNFPKIWKWLEKVWEKS